MKILVMSDSHRANNKIEECVKKEAPFDMLIHCGDVEGAEYFVEKLADCPVEMVMGNNDFFSSLTPEREFEVKGKKFFVTHGHYLYVSMGTERIREEAQSRGVDVVLFGHTHKPYMGYQGDILVLNPGSIAYPRQQGRRCSYAVLELDEKGGIKAEIRYLD